MLRYAMMRKTVYKYLSVAGAQPSAISLDILVIRLFVNKADEEWCAGKCAICWKDVSCAR